MKDSRKTAEITDMNQQNFAFVMIKKIRIEAGNFFNLFKS